MHDLLLEVTQIFNIYHVGYLFIGNWGQGNLIRKEYGSLELNFGVHDLLMEVLMEVTQKL